MLFQVVFCLTRWHESVCYYFFPTVAFVLSILFCSHFQAFRYFFPASASLSAGDLFWSCQSFNMARSAGWFTERTLEKIPSSLPGQQCWTPESCSSVLVQWRELSLWKSLAYCPEALPWSVVGICHLAIDDGVQGSPEGRSLYLVCRQRVLLNVNWT